MANLNLISKSIKQPKSIGPKKILILNGGWSGEREYSLCNGTDVATALTSMGHRVVTLDPPRDVELLVQKIKLSFEGHPPEVIFNALVGRWGEDGIFQGLFELLGIPYTSSSVLTSALAMNKSFSRKMVQLEGVTCPANEQLITRDELRGLCREFPYILKPICEGASIGLLKISSLEEQERAAEMWPYDGPQLLAQAFIPGREITVLVLGGKAMGALEICFEGDMLDSSQKKEKKNTLLMPAPLPPEDYDLALRMAETAHKALGCSGITRSDFRYDDTFPSVSKEGGAGATQKRLFYLETNTQPSIYRPSYAAAIAAHYGWTYEDLVEWIIEDALKNTSK